MNDHQQLKEKRDLPVIKRSSNVEIYGFVGWIVTFVILFLYLSYAYIPDEWLHIIGVTYYPDKYWAMAIPCFLCVVWITFFLWNYFYYHYNSYPLDDLRCIEDNRTKYLKRENIVLGSWENKNPKKTDPIVPIVRDLPLEIVNEMLFDKEED